MTSEFLGIRAYARHRKCAPSSVIKAIASGRLPQSVTRDDAGRPQIDPIRADIEWRDNTNALMHRDRQPRALVEGPALAAYSASCDLVALLATIEDRLWSGVFREAPPDAPAATWQQLHAVWSKLPDALERLQTRIRVLVSRPDMMTSTSTNGRPHP